MRTTYYPKWDTLSTVITGLVVVIAIYLIYHGIARASDVERWIMIIIALLISVVPMLLVPIRETFDPESRELTLHFVGYRRTISPKRFTKRLVGRDLMKKGPIRLYASGGLFGYWGKWMAVDGTVFTSYLTHASQEVHYLTDGSKIIALNAPEEWIQQMCEDEHW